MLADIFEGFFKAFLSQKYSMEKFGDVFKMATG